jgi:hypothetical protein
MAVAVAEAPKEVVVADAVTAHRAAEVNLPPYRSRSIIKRDTAMRMKTPPT